MPTILTDFYIKLLRLVLECNIFEFDREFYIQLLGTAMGTRVAPTYANLSMAKLEKFMLDSCEHSLKQFLLCWKRFIDDIFFIWCGSYEELEKNHNHLNSVHPTMKFDEIEHDKSENSCNFLDLTIKIKNGKIHTDLFRKETDKPTALLPSSAHPGHITHNIVYSMGFRILRICSEEENFKKRLSELKHQFLMPRNYKSKLIDDQFSRLRDLPGLDYKEKRKEALKKVKKEREQAEAEVVPSSS